MQIIVTIGMIACTQIEVVENSKLFHSLTLDHIGTCFFYLRLLQKLLQWKQWLQNHKTQIQRSKNHTFELDDPRPIPSQWRCHKRFHNHRNFFKKSFTRCSSTQLILTRVWTRENGGLFFLEEDQGFSLGGCLKYDRQKLEP